MGGYVSCSNGLTAFEVCLSDYLSKECSVVCQCFLVQHFIPDKNSLQSGLEIWNWCVRIINFICNSATTDLGHRWGFRYTVEYVDDSPIMDAISADQHEVFEWRIGHLFEWGIWRMFEWRIEHVTCCHDSKRSTHQPQSSIFCWERLMLMDLSLVQEYQLSSVDCHAGGFVHWYCSMVCMCVSVCVSCDWGLLIADVFPWQSARAAAAAAVWRGRATGLECLRQPVPTAAEHTQWVICLWCCLSVVLSELSVCGVCLSVVLSELVKLQCIA